MHDDSTYEDGRLTTCWNCKTEHYTLEDLPYKPSHDWRDLCGFCIVDYEEGKALGVQAVDAGRSDFERRSLHGAKRLGYMAGRFLRAAEKGRKARAAA